MSQRRDGVASAARRLVLRGLRGRRVGSTPFCGKCGDTLPGNVGWLHPECGTAVEIGEVT